MNRGLSLRLGWVLLAGCLCLLAGRATAQIQLPAIDPTGNRIFLPPGQTTPLLGPGSAGTGLFGHHRSNVPAAPASSSNPFANWFGHGQRAAPPAQPAFTHPPDPPSCNSCGLPGCRGGAACGLGKPKQHIIPRPTGPLDRGRSGEIIMTPYRIVAPVGSEVVVLAGICGGDGHFVKNQPLEWMLSNDSVGQIIEVGGMEHPAFNSVVPPSSEKIDGQFARGRTGLKHKLLTRGTPTPVDDIDVLDGQTYISLSSASAGTTYLTAVAPNAAGWDKRRATTVIHWVDGQWSIPAPIVTSSGTVQPLTTAVTRMADGTGIQGWKVRYSIVGGTPAEFLPTGSQTAEVDTGRDGQATVQVRQQAGKIEPGTTQIRVDVVRPAIAGEQELVVESGLTGITWSSPALTLRAIGPRAAAINESYNYRLEISNPGDQTARDVIVSTDDLGDAVEFISSDPKPTVYGKRYEWRLGDLPPGQMPAAINVQLKSGKRGMKRSCFRVASQSDQLQTEACAETEVAAPCLGLRLDGPTSARVGDEFEFNIEVVNQCDEALNNIVITAQYDPGLVAMNLGNPVQANIGSLQFGEKRTLPLRFRAVADGVQCFALNVVADGGHTAGGRRCIEVANVATGQVSLQVSGPQIVARGQNVDATATVTNTGNVPIDALTVTNRFSASLEPAGATEQYPHNWLGNDLAFFVGRLSPGQTAQVAVRYEAREIDEQAFTQFSVSSPSGSQAEQKLDIRVESGQGGAAPAQPNQANIGIPADPAGSLRVQVESLDPEIVADGRSTGRIRFSVANNRTSADQNVRITLLIPPGLQFAGLDSSQGQLKIATSSADGTRFSLETRREMRSGEVLSFVLSVVSTVAGNSTVEIQATSDNTLGSVTGQSSIRAVPGR